MGAALVAMALVVYTLSHPVRFYDHFAWQASAFLEGQAAIRYPVAATATSPGNAFFQDVLPVASPDGIPRALVPFPPLPAVVLLPFVAIWGLNADGQLVFGISQGASDPELYSKSVAALGLGGPLCTTESSVRGWFNPDCPLLLPRDTGMSLLLTSPGYLLVLPALRWGYGHSRLVTGAALAVLFVAVVNAAPMPTRIAERTFIRSAASPSGWSRTEASQPRSTYDG